MIVGSGGLQELVGAVLLRQAAAASLGRLLLDFYYALARSLDRYSHTLSSATPTNHLASLFPALPREQATLSALPADPLAAALDDETKTRLTEEELAEMLQSDYNMDDVCQSGAPSAAQLAKLLDREHMAENRPAPYQLKGVGYEVVQRAASSLLQAVE